VAAGERLDIGGGRSLPRLLFVTSRDALGRNVGADKAQSALDALRADGHVVFDGLPPSVDASQAPVLVRPQLGREGEVEGVVLLGGYDVVPPQRLDCLPPQIRADAPVESDADEFLVWSDDAYGDRDGDTISELPVSRIPDCASSSFFFAALSAKDSTRAEPRRGVRNVARPFAGPIYDTLPGTQAMLVSVPTTPGTAGFLDGELVYLMLHGKDTDATHFWGEDGQGGYPKAVALANIHDPAPHVVFTGCCWGALIAEKPALKTPAGQIPAARTAASSIALSFLEHGATAFVGCTGSHYSPTVPPLGYAGGPMHESFWKAVLAGSAPAKALFEAKIEYVRGFPHGRTGAGEVAVEYKILREYTCLGLGW
jgi:hypothetical protein